MRGFDKRKKKHQNSEKKYLLIGIGYAFLHFPKNSKKNIHGLHFLERESILYNTRSQNSINARIKNENEFISQK